MVIFLGTYHSSNHCVPLGLGSAPLLRTTRPALRQRRRGRIAGRQLARGYVDRLPFPLVAAPRRPLLLQELLVKLQAPLRAQEVLELFLVGKQAGVAGGSGNLDLLLPVASLQFLIGLNLLRDSRSETIGAPLAARLHRLRPRFSGRIRRPSSVRWRPSWGSRRRGRAGIATPTR